MKTMTRRQFLGKSATAVLGLGMMGSRPCIEMLNQSQLLDKKELFKEIELQAEQTLSAYSAPGLAASAVFDRRPFYAKGFGVMDIQKAKPYTAQTVQTVGSMSKAFAGVAIMQLVEAGKMNIDQPLVELVPYFRLKDSRYTAIKIRHLLAHSSGLPGATCDDFFCEYVNPWYDDGAAERYVRSLADMDFTLSSDPGDPNNFVYSDVGYDILATVIQQVSGQVFEYYCQDHIMRPLGMSHTTFLLPQVPKGLLFTPYIPDEDGQPVVSPVFPYNRAHSPSSCILTDANDMLLWMLMHLNGGELHGKRILSPASHAKLWEPLFTWPDGWGYGWGWDQFYDEQGRLTIFHGGEAPGVLCIMVLVPCLGLGAFGVGNFHGPPSFIWYSWDFGVWLYGRLLEEIDGAAVNTMAKVNHKMVNWKHH